MAVELTLPFPPSVNRYWRAPTTGKLAGRHLISEAGRNYRREAIAMIRDQYKGEPLSGRLEVTLILCPPDRRKRDIDNYCKGLFDAMSHAGFWLDDEQIDRLTIIKDAPQKGGQCFLEVVEIKN